MESEEFHIRKIREILNALEYTNDDLFLKCVSLFYLGVHLIDLYLASQGFPYVKNHGDRKNLLRKVNKDLVSKWDSLFSVSNDQRYRAITSEAHLKALKEDVSEILSAIDATTIRK